MRLDDKQYKLSIDLRITKAISHLIFFQNSDPFEVYTKPENAKCLCLMQDAYL